uniref:Uncharacterized protein n=1 Tax=Trichuris muris TaxID=70415 RepID=A0A5S6R5H1_TRIMR
MNLPFTRIAKLIHVIHLSPLFCTPRSVFIAKYENFTAAQKRPTERTTSVSLAQVDDTYLSNILEEHGRSPTQHPVLLTQMVHELPEDVSPATSLAFEKPTRQKRSVIFVLTTMIPPSSRYPHTDPNDTAFLSGNVSDRTRRIRQHSADSNSSASRALAERLPRGLQQFAAYLLIKAIRRTTLR